MAPVILLGSLAVMTWGAFAQDKALIFGAATTFVIALIGWMMEGNRRGRR